MPTNSAPNVATCATFRSAYDSTSPSPGAGLPGGGARQFIVTVLHHRAANNFPKVLDDRTQALFVASRWASPNRVGFEIF
ncbi:hypothetical protein [Ralstonia solanacearum]|uniref:hypothetical protein n=1 Tax=Ralstonia solanacearum TaxID=305 RepID=UPI0011A2E653|nr:hypothetical protein [Ralstonia solanacearum]